MADAKISALTDGVRPLATDALAIARSGANVRLPASWFAQIPGVYLPIGWDDAWKTALAASGASPAVVGVLGDSICRGYYASVLNTLGFAGRIKTSLQGTYGDGGSGFISTGADLVGVPTGFAAQMKVTASGFSAGGLGAGPGAGGSVSSTTNGNTLTFTCDSCTIIDIWYLTGAGLGTFTYAVDAGAAVPVVTAGSNGTGLTTVTGLGAGSHTVVITVTSAGSGVFICGVTARNAAGVRVDNYSQQGLGDITGNATWGLTALWSGGPSNPAHCLILSVGANQEVSNETGDAYIAALALNLEQIRSTTTDISVLLVLPHIGPSWSANNKAQDYAARLPGLANRFGCGFLDVGGRFKGSWAAANALSYWSTGSGTSGSAGSDSVHPGDTGHLTLANQIIPILLGTTPAVPS